MTERYDDLDPSSLTHAAVTLRRGDSRLLMLACALTAMSLAAGCPSADESEADMKGEKGDAGVGEERVASRTCPTNGRGCMYGDHCRDAPGEMAEAVCGEQGGEWLDGPCPSEGALACCVMGSQGGKPVVAVYYDASAAPDSSSCTGDYIDLTGDGAQSTSADDASPPDEATASGGTDGVEEIVASIDGSEVRFRVNGSVVNNPSTVPPNQHYTSVSGMADGPRSILVTFAGVGLGTFRCGDASMIGITYTDLSGTAPITGDTREVRDGCQIEVTDFGNDGEMVRGTFEGSLLSQSGPISIAQGRFAFRRAGSAAGTRTDPGAGSADAGDAGQGPTAGSSAAAIPTNACDALELDLVGESIAETVGEGSPPEMTGGELVDGTYVLVGRTAYGDPCDCLGSTTLQITDTTSHFEFVSKNDTDAAKHGAGAIVLPSADTLELMAVCPSAGSIALGYTVTDTGLLLFDASKQRMETFEKQ